jgi:hypothetical protein
MSSYESSGVDFFLILFHQCSRLLQFALDDRRNKNFSGVGRMNVLLRQERYDVCRIHLNKEKKGSEKLFFFFRVWADAARPASLVVLIATAAKFCCCLRVLYVVVVGKKLFPVSPSTTTHSSL